MFLCNALQYYGVLVLAFNILFKVYKRQIKKSSMFVLGLQKYHFFKKPLSSHTTDITLFIVQQAHKLTYLAVTFQYIFSPNIQIW